MPELLEKFDDVIREYIALVNAQVGVYMDALSGFAGHHVRIERQVNRVLGPKKRLDPKSREQVIVWTSYEDPSRPDVIHNRIIRADEYIAINERDGSNEVQQARSVIIFLFTYWELEIRPRLAAAAGVDLNEIQSEIMGDIRLIRHAILHVRGVLRLGDHQKLKVLADMFLPDKPIRPNYDDMHRIFVLMKQDCAQLMCDWLQVPKGTIDPATVRDIALQQVREPNSEKSD